MDMSLAWAVSRRKLQDDGLGACQRVRVLALAHFADSEASRERIRALFHSPLGIYVSQAQREGCELRLEFDTASEDLAFTLRTLKRVLPEARVEGIAPRVFAHRMNTRDAG
ncbi:MULTISPECIES: hypothetical protein [Caballeronia]|jgi:predicted protein tyrosine phosphatase|uniref:AsnC family transcriptional regulator n=1 Tax=Caballeronia zhejiangensis TaxID=871203 RepID=A0A656QMA1_9BURK|nr:MULTISPECIES: hypothetical protein [Caballeronia]EKS66888.1 hypothetical protein BURK_033619 [Burkholderia sp. SJ98]KDR30648.1 hypothetical protein BG60_36640 [Caballeronia zhejiangensis]MDR5789831.1 hypothetical protein [Caballeronia sp. LP003]